MKKAFTLAEVLITLGIIGIVAAMTLPTLIGNYQKKQTVEKLKKSYAILQQAVQLSEVENGNHKYWNYSLRKEEFFEKYLKNFIKIKGQAVNSSGITYKQLNGQNCSTSLCLGESYIASLIDGTTMIISGYNDASSKGRVISFDINGYRKPNIIGRDFFSFAIAEDYGVIPFGYKDYGSLTNETFGEFDRDVIKGSSANRHACNRNFDGIWCAALIMLDGWEIKDDYPW